MENCSSIYPHKIARNRINPEDVINQIKLEYRDYSDRVEHLCELGLLQVYTGLVTILTAKGRLALRKKDSFSATDYRRTKVEEIKYYIYNEYKSNPIKTIAATLSIAAILIGAILALPSFISSDTQSDIVTNSSNSSMTLSKKSINSTEYGNHEVLKPYVEPQKGSLNDSYIYNIQRKDANYSELILEIRDPRRNAWMRFGKGQINSDIISFKVPDLSFIEPPFLGFIEFRLIKGDEIIGPFNGPYIDINYMNIAIDTVSKRLHVDVISEICVRDLCLKYDNLTYKARYNGCSRWQKVTFKDLNLNFSNQDIVLDLRDDCSS